MTLRRRVFCLPVSAHILILGERPYLHLFNRGLSTVFYSIGAIISQITILALTLVKYKVAIKGGWAKAPIMTLMVRDGTVIFFIFLSMRTIYLNIQPQADEKLVITILTVVYTSEQTDHYGLIGTSYVLPLNVLRKQTLY